MYFNVIISGPPAVLPAPATRGEYVCAPGALVIMPPSGGDVSGARCTCYWNLIHPLTTMVKLVSSIRVLSVHLDFPDNLKPEDRTTVSVPKILSNASLH